MTRARDTANIIGNLDAVTAGDVVTVDANGNPESAGTRANPSLILNGGFDVWQRGTSFSAGASQFASDRWYMAGTDKTTDRSTQVPTGENFTYSSFVASTTSAAAYRTPLELSITGEEAPFNISTTYTLSFWIRDHGTGGAAIRAYAYFSDGSSGANSVFNLLDTSQTTAATNTWKKVSYTFSITNAANPTNTAMCVEVGLNGVGQCNITGVKLEQGSVATPWFYEDIGTTLAKCQRYYYKDTSSGATVCRGRNSYATTTIQFPVKMRVIPTMDYTINSDDATNGSIIASADHVNLTALIGDVNTTGRYGMDAGWAANAEL